MKNSASPSRSAGAWRYLYMPAWHALTMRSAGPRALSGAPSQGVAEGARQRLFFPLLMVVVLVPGWMAAKDYRIRKNAATRPGILAGGYLVWA